MRAALRELLFTEDKLYPPRLGSLAAWYDSLDPVTMLAGNGTQITDGGAVALWADKSGNSGVNCLVLPGVAANYASVLDSEAHPTENIEVLVRVAMADWTPSAATSILGKWTSTGNQRAWLLYVNTDGTLQFNVSTNGLVSGSIKKTDAALGFSDFSIGWVKASWTGSTGAIVLSISSDGVTWAVPAATQSATATGTVYDSSSGINVGYNDAGTALLNGRVYRAIVKDGIDGTTVLDIDFSTAGKKLANGDTFVCSTGQTVTLNSSGATGARIAGERDLFQGTAANRPVYLAYSGTKYGYLNGVSGNYFSAPDSAAVSIADDVDIICEATLASWAPAANNHLVSRWTTTGDQRSYRFGVSGSLGAGVLYFSLSTLGTAASATNYVSTAATGFAANSRNFVRVHRNKTTGDIKFYTSSNGTSWTQLGTTVSGSTSAMFDGTSVLELGGITSGTVEPMTGRIYRAQIWSGDSTSGGTLVADFNPALYTSGTTFTASTGEVWTVNGGAHIVTRTGLYFDGSNDYLKTAAFSLSQPESVYGVLSQVTWTLNDPIYDGSSDASMLLWQSTATPAIRLYAGADAGENDDLSLKTGGVVSSVFNGASSLNRVNRFPAVTGNAGTSVPNGFLIASRGAPGGYSNIFASEVAIYSAAHPTATQDRWALYAGRRHSFAS